MMNRRSGLFRRIPAVSLATLASAACVTWTPVTQPLPEVLASTQHIRVTTVDSVTFQLQGGEPDAIRVEGGNLVGPLGSGTVAVPLSDIAHVEMSAGSSGKKTAVFAASVVVIGALLLLLMGGVEVGGQP